MLGMLKHALAARDERLASAELPRGAVLVELILPLELGHLARWRQMLLEPLLSQKFGSVISQFARA